MTATRTLGDAHVFPIGLGGMPLSLEGRPDEDQSIRTIHAALDAGVNLIDTADAYAYDDADVGHNERLIAKALRGRRDGVVVATKGGHTRRGQAWEVDGRPEHIRAACEASLAALETDVIDLYQFHRPDPAVPYAESIGAFRELQDAGKVRWVGVSNASVEQLSEALAGDDRHAEVRRRFIGSFVRPLGLETPATPALVDALEDAARAPAPAPRPPSHAVRALRAALALATLGAELRSRKGRERRRRAVRRRLRAAAATVRP